MSGAKLDRDGWILMGLGLVMIANAFWMFAAPMHWYRELPAAVPDTGPYNPHFVRDIACAFLSAGMSLVWGARSLRYRVPLVAMATSFLTAHAMLHVYDTTVGNLPTDHWWLDFGGVYLPVLLLAYVLYRMPWRRPA